MANDTVNLTIYIKCPVCFGTKTNELMEDGIPCNTCDEDGYLEWGKASGEIIKV